MLDKYFAFKVSFIILANSKNGGGRFSPPPILLYEKEITKGSEFEGKSIF